MGFLSFLQRTGTAKKEELPLLSFYNTLSGSLEEFKPIGKGPVKMYNCGPTVYDRQHIGNMRPYVFADTLKRTLEAWGYEVKQVINITDVGHLVSDNDEGEDKMEKSAKARGQSAKEIAEEVTQLFFEDLDALGIQRKAIQFPRATEYIGEQIALVKSLEQKGYAYKIDDGVYFDTSRFPAYGKLGNIDLAGLKDGARVEENMQKKNPHDFALWKFSKKGEERQQEWESPWGVGFPGWHIECTAMIFKLLGKQIDIHTGGIDHIPVHHNNEIAQAESISGKQYARYWMHNAFITIESRKVSKSLGNTVYVSQLVDRGLSPRALRYLFLTAHYRSPINFTWESVEGANAALNRLMRFFFEDLAHIKNGEPDKTFMHEFYSAIAEDLGTAKAIARVWDLVKDESVSPEAKRASLLAADKVLGLGFTEKRPTTKLSIFERNELPEEVQTLLTAREAARGEKNFTEADRLRGEIETLGYELSDGPTGPTVTKK